MTLFETIINIVFFGYNIMIIPNIIIKQMDLFYCHLTKRFNNFGCTVHVGQIVYIALLSFQNISFLPQKLIEHVGSRIFLKRLHSDVTHIQTKGLKALVSALFAPSLPVQNHGLDFNLSFTIDPERLGMTWAKDWELGSMMHFFLMETF